MHFAWNYACAGSHIDRPMASSIGLKGLVLSAPPDYLAAAGAGTACLLPQIFHAQECGSKMRDV